MSEPTDKFARELDAAQRRVWNVRVEDDRIWADTENEARAEFIQALVEDGSLIHVTEADPCG